MNFLETLKQLWLVVIKTILKIENGSLFSKTIRLHLPDDKTPIFIPTILGKKMVYKKILMPIIRREQSENVIGIKLPEMKYELYLRPMTSDLYVFEQIFVFQEYDIQFKGNPRFIIDGGANIGLSSIFFAQRYPEAKIVAIEPDETNFQILKKNTTNYSNISNVQAGIWYKTEDLCIRDDGHGKWLLMVEKKGNSNKENIQSITIKQLLENSEYDKIDILKIDIEGTEKYLFSNSYKEWLGLTNMLIIELHDRLVPGCSDVFYKAIKGYGFNQSKKGENLVFSK